MLYLHSSNLNRHFHSMLEPETAGRIQRLSSSSEAHSTYSTSNQHTVWRLWAFSKQSHWSGKAEQRSTQTRCHCILRTSSNQKSVLTFTPWNEKLRRRGEFEFASSEVMPRLGSEHIVSKQFKQNTTTAVGFVACWNTSTSLLWAFFRDFPAVLHLTLVLCQILVGPSSVKGFAIR